MIIPITPIGKPRMTKADAWKQRPCVLKYWEYKNKLRELLPDYEVPEILSGIVFVLPMPTSWSKKKKDQHNNAPHKAKPDLDNIVKGFKDCLCKNDSYVHRYDNISKVWGHEGQIIIGGLPI